MPMPGQAKIPSREPRMGDRCVAGLLFEYGRKLSIWDTGIIRRLYMKGVSSESNPNGLPRLQYEDGYSHLYLEGAVFLRQHLWLEAKGGFIQRRTTIKTFMPLWNQVPCPTRHFPSSGRQIKA